MSTLISPIILIIGTRPEGIKLFPVYFSLKKAGLPVKICATFQHTDLLQTVFELFNIQPDFNFNIMQANQDLFHITRAVLQNCQELFLLQKPQLVIVQGDTTSAMAAALAAFYLKVPVAHVEAGLRTNDIYAPYPEELNRQFIGLIAKYHFAPSKNSVLNLQKSGVSAKAIYQVGNTVVDALNLVNSKLAAGDLRVRPEIALLLQKIINQNQKIVLMTMHRRESLGHFMQQALAAIKKFASSHGDVCFIYPMHPNPQVQKIVAQINLSLCANIFLLPALPYHELIYLLDKAQVVMTDSGGISEEAASLAKPVLLLRNQTDRPEAVEAGLAWLVGCNQTKINHYLKHALSLPLDKWQTQIYGNGNSANQIVKILRQEIKMVKVAIIGLGYIGLPTAILLAETGFEVHGYDIDEHKIAGIKKGVCVIQEQELGARLNVVLKQDNFNVDTKLDVADYFLITVPTPIDNDKKADLKYVWQAVGQIANFLKPGDCVIIESTVPVGTTNQISEYLAQKTGLRAGQDFFVAFSPERVIPGKIFHELIHNNRLIGGINQQSSNLAVDFYAEFVKGQISMTDSKTAEMVKLVENSSRDVQIAFANQVASIAQAAGINAQEVIAFANQHPRVQILNPGCGVGGHCIAVDPWFLIESFPNQSNLLHAARKINDQKPFEVLAEIDKKIDNLKISLGKNKLELCVLGVTYKPDIDDLRNSPALLIAQKLQERVDLNLTVVEPNIDLNILHQYFKFAVNKFEHLILPPDLIILLVAHNEFRQKTTDLFHNQNVLDFGAITGVEKTFVRENR
jgi:UDP-N-acetylglucosamine 2-epimerase (non-hydrolysing)